MAGDFRVVWQGNGNGDPRGWDTFYRRTTDGGVTWSAMVKLSNRSTGAPYKTRAGYFFPYGDYISLSVDAAGDNHVIWGEGTSYNGPGAFGIHEDSRPRCPRHSLRSTKSRAMRVRSSGKSRLVLTRRASFRAPSP